jgi:spermidine synthase
VSAAGGGEPAGAAAPAPSRRGLLLLVFVGGASSLGAEIAAARLLAPYFGASTIIWANTIGVVLVALSVGYWLGGRLADRHPNERALRLTVLGAAVLLALVPLVAGPLLEVAVFAFDRIDAGAFLGSLLGVLLLVAVPVLLLGMVSPWAIRLAVRAVTEAGEVAGRLYGLSTVGSLLGVFLSALVLIPFAGTQRTFIGFAAVLALAAAGTGLPRRALLVPLGLAALLALPPGVTKPAEDAGEAVIHETESEYQYVRVLEDRADGERTLELNEGQAVHSVYRPDSVLTGGVWDGYAVLPFARLQRPPRRVAMLGNAAGTVSRAYERFFPATAIDGVEIDPRVSDAGRRYFDMDNPRLRIHDEDARPFLRRARGGYDLIGIDAYRQPYIPFYLATREFFALARSRLAPGGAVMLNVGHPPGQDGLERVLSATMGSVFAHVRRYPIAPENTLLIASDSSLSRERLAAASRFLPAALAPVLEDATARLGPPLRGGRVYTDDRAPVEWLIDSSIVRYAAGDGEGG